MADRGGRGKFKSSGQVKMSLALIYLARGVDQGLYSAKQFFQAYDKFPADEPHDLVVLCKGFNETEIPVLKRLAEERNATVIDLPDDGFDWELTCVRCRSCHTHGFAY